jgi:hypothetical protein
MQVNVDFEHFQKNDTEKEDLVGMICLLQAELKEVGLRLHSMDFAPWGYVLVCGASCG